MLSKGVLYIFFNYAIQIANIFLNIIFMQRLTPTTLGDIALAKTLMQFLDYTHLGTRFSMDRYLPTAENKYKLYLLSSSLGVTFLFNSILFVVSIIFSDFNIIIVLFLCVGYVCSLSNIFKSYFRGVGLINEMILLVFYVQLVPLVFSVLIYLLFDNVELFAFLYSLTTIITFFIILLINRILVRNILECVFDKVFSTISKVALPSLFLFFNSIFTLIYLVIDRYFIDYFLGREVLGIYSVISFAFSALLVVPATMTELIFQKVVVQTASNHRWFFPREIIILLSSTLISVLIANMLMDFFITNYTSYGEYISLIRLSTFSVIPFAISSLLYHILNALDARRNMLTSNMLIAFSYIVYYFSLNFVNHLDLNYFIYPKLCLGWFVVIAYIICIKIELSNKKELGRLDL